MPILVSTVLVVGFMGYYFWRTTTNPLRPTYVENIKQYAVAPYFPWQALKPIPEYRNVQMQQFYEEWPVAQYEEARHHPIRVLLLKAVWFCLFFTGPIFLAPFITLSLALPVGFQLRDISPSVRYLGLVFVFSLIGLTLPIFFLPHYAAPLTCVFYALTATVLRYLWNWTNNGKLSGRTMTRAFVSACILLIPVRTLALRLNIHLAAPALKTWASAADQMTARDVLAKEIVGSRGMVLLIVRYSAEHDYMREWVYNGADIEHEKIIWARDMGPEKNQELIDYFKERRVWLLQPDETPPRLQPYPEVSQSRISERPAP